jgi:hypothetical protein
MGSREVGIVLTSGTHAVRRSSRGVVTASVLVLGVALASAAYARPPEKPRPAAEASDAKAPEPACEHPCTHVRDCPKVTCECAEDSASGVAACDAQASHCCVGAEVACEQFCDLHHQQWTGRYTPESSTRPEPRTASDEASKAPAAEPPPCAEPCDKAEDCTTMTCKCAHTTVEDVAACDAKGHCCAPTEVVCQHYCAEKKDKWTGR